MSLLKCLFGKRKEPRLDPKHAELHFKICEELNYLTWRQNQMGIDLKKLADEVAEIESTHASAIQVIASLKSELEDVSDKLANSNVDTTELDVLISKLDASKEALAAAIATTPNG